MDQFNKYLNRQILPIQRKYRRLGPEHRETLLRAFVRHAKACAKTKVDPDPLWLSEAITDVQRDRL